MSDILWYVKLKCALFKSVVKFQKTLRTFCSLWKSIFCFIEESFIIFLSHLDAPASFVPLVDFKERPQQWNWIGRNNYLFCYSPFSVHLNSQSLQNEYWILNMNIPKKINSFEFIGDAIQCWLKFSSLIVQVPVIDFDCPFYLESWQMLTSLHLLLGTWLSRVV